MTSLWVRQVRGMLRMELKKNLFSVRAVPIYVLASLPLFAVGLFMVVATITGVPGDVQGPAGSAQFYAIIFQFILRFVIFLGCVWLFMNLFRGEVLDRSLHYYFLSPIRREVLVAGKYLSALFSSSIQYGASVCVSFIAIRIFLASGDLALGQLAAYLAITFLACLGYGAVFLLIGQLMRNPLIPAVLIFVWEGFNSFLPVFLKKISVIFYLQSLYPIPPPEGSPFAIIADPTPPWLAVAGLIAFTALTLAVAGWRIRSMEVAYGTD